MCLSFMLVERLLNITVRSLLDDVGMLAGELVYPGLVKLSRADFVLEKDIEFAISTSLGLWKAEISPGAKNEASTSPEES